MRAGITRVTNGWKVLVTGCGDGDGEYVHEIREGTDEDAAAVETWADVLTTLNEHLGPSTGRCSPARVCVVVEPGDKCGGGA